ncbi:MAG TPA: HlyD family efflux transporter periplasmic adaptor subunit [Myxococcaceae bacterium]|nr:HlyD family efflux transporter periplasmic adaptor subunit [Myxococcaceae bacterium]
METHALRLKLSQDLKSSPKTLGRAITVASVFAFLVSGVLVLRHLDALPRTDDAIVTANTIRIVPEITGRIATLNVKDDATVHKGDVLYTIESERYELNLAAARAQVQALEAEIDLTDRRVSSQVTAIAVARAHAESARARLKEATDTLGRMEPLLPERFVTPQQIDMARTAKATAESQLAGALSATQQTREAVGDSKALAAQLLAARALVGQAERDLRNTVVRAPFDGRVVGVTTSVGQFVDPVKPLFTLIDTSQWYIIADFRETELPSIRPGDRVTGYVMTEPGVHLRGSVESVGSAVAELDNLAIAGVPPVQRDLNWIRIAQRFPVRITLENPPPDLMRIGASAVVVVRHGRR